MSGQFSKATYIVTRCKGMRYKSEGSPYGWYAGEEIRRLFPSGLNIKRGFMPIWRSDA